MNVDIVVKGFISLIEKLSKVNPKGAKLLKNFFIFMGKNKDKISSTLKKGKSSGLFRGLGIGAAIAGASVELGQLIYKLSEKTATIRDLVELAMAGVGVFAAFIKIANPIGAIAMIGTITLLEFLIPKIESEWLDTKIITDNGSYFKEWSYA